MQQVLFTELLTAPSPLCHKEPRCAPRGRSVIGAPEDRGGCINRLVTCLDCAMRGELSTAKQVEITR